MADKDSMLSEVKKSSERIMAISLHRPDEPGIIGIVIDFDDFYIEFLGEKKGKLEMLPRSAYKLRRIEKEVRK